MTPSTRVNGEAFLLEAKCDACNREAGLLMCALCEAMTVAEMFPAHPCPARDDCALNKGAIHCKHCGRNWPPDETWASVPLV